MKEQLVCIKFNEKNGCKEKASTHPNQYDKSQVLRHVCGGCHKKTGAEDAHAAFGCRQGPFGQLFR